eukprot:Opistho-2@82264
MANKGNKRVLEVNKKVLANHFYPLVGINLFYILVRIFYFYDSFFFWDGVAFLFLAFVEFFCYKALADMATPEFAADGELLGAGMDLTFGGIAEYYKDVIYVTLFVQVGSIYSSRFLLFWLLIPIFALYKLWVGIIAPWIFAPAPEPMDEETKKKLEKKEKKANRVKYVSR